MVTRATVGHLRSYPYALDPFLIEATVSRQLDHGQKDSLKRPILDDHVSKVRQQVRHTLRVVCEFVCYFHVMFYLVHVSW